LKELLEEDVNVLVNLQWEEERVSIEERDDKERENCFECVVEVSWRSKCI